MLVLIGACCVRANARHILYSAVARGDASLRGPAHHTVSAWRQRLRPPLSSRRRCRRSPTWSRRSLALYGTPLWWWWCWLWCVAYSSCVYAYLCRIDVIAWKLLRTLPPANACTTTLQAHVGSKLKWTKSCWWWSAAMSTAAVSGWKPLTRYKQRRMELLIYIGHLSFISFLYKFLSSVGWICVERCIDR